MSLLAAATGLQVVGTLMEARAQSQTAKFNAKVARQNAEITRQQGEDAASIKRREVNARLGSIRARAGAGFGGTSAEDILADSAYRGALAVADTKYNYELRSLSLMTEAELQDAEASNALRAGLIRAGTQGASGYYQYQRDKELYGSLNTTGVQ